MTTAGATQITSSIALVETLAPTATLHPTMRATVANHPPTSHIREVFNMILDLLQVGLESMENPIEAFERAHVAIARDWTDDSCALRSVAEVGLSARTRKGGHCSNAGGLSAV
jgi:hypothetical protein